MTIMGKTTSKPVSLGLIIGIAIAVIGVVGVIAFLSQGNSLGSITKPYNSTFGYRGQGYYAYKGGVFYTKNSTAFDTAIHGINTTSTTVLTTASSSSTYSTTSTSSTSTTSVATTTIQYAYKFANGQNTNIPYVSVVIGSGEVWLNESGSLYGLACNSEGYKGICGPYQAGQNTNIAGVSVVNISSNNNYVWLYENTNASTSQSYYTTTIPYATTTVLLTPTCQTGYVYGSDGLCHLECGSSTTYCVNQSAYCYNNECVTCPKGDYLGTNGYCYPYSNSTTTVSQSYTTTVPQSNSTSALYDEQSGFTFANADFQDIVYNVSAVAQSALSGTGPAYLINGYTNEGYWYQIGLSYDWVTNDSNSHYIGFRANYEVFAPNGTSIYPGDEEGGVSEIYGNVNPGDNVKLGLYINTTTNKVTMSLYDWTTGAYYTTSYPSFGATEFVANPSSTGTNGFFTGLMTEWYNTAPTFGNQLEVLYREYGTVQGNVWLWNDEFYCADGYRCQSKQNIFANATATSISCASPYTFSSDGFSEECYNNAEDFATGVS